jgi:hypothetical protein
MIDRDRETDRQTREIKKEWGRKERDSHGEYSRAKMVERQNEKERRK